MAFVSVDYGVPKKGEEVQKVTGKLIDDGKKILLAIEDGKNFIVKVVPVLKDMILEAVEIFTPLYNELVKLFARLFRRLPTHIEWLGTVYRLTMQPAYFEMPDKVFYLIEKEKKGVDKILIFAEDTTLFKAKTKIRTLLQNKELI